MKKILLVDDNADFLDLLYLALSDSFDVFTARTKHEALSFLKTKEIDVLLSDFHIANHNAVELIDEIISLEINIKQIVIIVMSGSGELGDTEFPTGINHFLLKPFGMKELKKIIDDQLL